MMNDRIRYGDMTYQDMRIIEDMRETKTICVMMGCGLGATSPEDLKVNV